MRISDWSSDVCSSDLPCGSGGDMIAPGATLRVYVATRPVDFRKGHDGLAAAVQEMFGLDPFSGAVFVFRSKRADRVKLLVWDRTGLVLRSEEHTSELQSLMRISYAVFCLKKKKI